MQDAERNAHEADPDGQEEEEGRNNNNAGTVYQRAPVRAAREINETEDAAGAAGSWAALPAQQQRQLLEETFRRAESTAEVEERNRAGNRREVPHAASEDIAAVAGLLGQHAPHATRRNHRLWGAVLACDETGTVQVTSYELTEPEDTNAYMRMTLDESFETMAGRCSLREALASLAVPQPQPSTAAHEAAAAAAAAAGTHPPAIVAGPDAALYMALHYRGHFAALRVVIGYVRKRTRAGATRLCSVLRGQVLESMEENSATSTSSRAAARAALHYVAITLDEMLAPSADDSSNGNGLPEPATANLIRNAAARTRKELDRGTSTGDLLVSFRFPESEFARQVVSNSCGAVCVQTLLSSVGAPAANRADAGVVLEPPAWDDTPTSWENTTFREVPDASMQHVSEPGTACCNYRQWTRAAELRLAWAGTRPTFRFTPLVTCETTGNVTNPTRRTFAASPEEVETHMRALLAGRGGPNGDGGGARGGGGEEERDVVLPLALSRGSHIPSPSSH